VSSARLLERAAEAHEKIARALDEQVAAMRAFDADSAGLLADFESAVGGLAGLVAQLGGNAAVPLGTPVAVDSLRRFEVPVLPARPEPVPPAPGVWDRFWSVLGGSLADTGNVFASVLRAYAEHPEYLLQTAGGVVLMVVGVGGEAGGGLLDLTGIGAAVGVPAGVLAAGAVAAGAGMVTMAARGAAEAAGAHPARPFKGPDKGSGPPWPTKVTGYTKHAVKRMEQRGVTRGQVEDIVDSPKGEPKWQKKRGTWLFERDGIQVAVNDDGAVVTVIV